MGSYQSNDLNIFLGIVGKKSFKITSRERYYDGLKWKIGFNLIDLSPGEKISFQ